MAAALFAAAGCGGAGEPALPEATQTAAPKTPKVPEGPLIAYARRAAGETDFAIHAMNPRGGDDRRISAGPGYEPAWAPETTQLVFTSTRDGEPRLYTIAFDGSAEAPLLDTPSQHPAWSPEGLRIAYTGENGALFVMNSDGTAPVELAAAGSHPTWSVDGAQIAYAAPEGIAIIDRDGGEPALLTEAGDSRPAWSPDGRRIAFFRAAADEHSLNLVETQTGKVVTLAEFTEPPGESRPTWSPDARTIVFEGAGVQLFEVPADGSREPARLTDPPDGHASPAFTR